MIGPVGAGGAVVEVGAREVETVFELVEPLIDAGLVVPIVLTVLVGTGSFPSRMNILRRLPPPHHCSELPLQTMLQPLTFGSELDWLTEPAARTFPQ